LYQQIGISYFIMKYTTKRENY